LKPLVEQYGGELVYWAGLKTLGYPPIMVHTTAEAMQIAKALAG